MFNQIRRGDKVEGKYLGVSYTGTVVSVTDNEWTKNREVEIDFGGELSGFRGRDWDKRNGLLLTGISEGEYIKRVA